MLLSILVFGTLMTLIWKNIKKIVVVVNVGENMDLQQLLGEPVRFKARNTLSITDDGGAVPGDA